MAKIRILEQTLANKIAAGEVVERPASVVKELVENAIDAGSTAIEVEIVEAGLATIRIADNGSGMDREDVENAFYRHATSKISQDRDLFRIMTLGFRGEALPSIAAVSKVKITSRLHTEHIGHHYVIEGGQGGSLTQKAAPLGTEIVVENLFYNTPARLKYLKSLQTELNHIQNIINRLAFSYPNIAFKLINEGREILRTSGDGNLLSVIHAVYGLDVAKKMVPIEGVHLDFRISGLIGKPEINRRSRGYMTILVNGRYVHSYVLQKAILDGYHTLLPIHRFPFTVIHIEMDATLVDVNVHPTKMEVRFSKESELASWLTEKVRSTLFHQSLIPTPEIRRFGTREPVVQEKLNLSWNIEQHHLSQQSSRDHKLMEQSSTYEENRHNRRDLDEKGQSVKSMENDAEKHSLRLPLFEPLAQFHHTYILAQGEEGLFLIDQHAAQERINYERIRAKLGRGSMSSQLLAIPYTIELTYSEAELIRRSYDLLQEVGLNLESFGERSFIVREVPDWFIKEKEEEQINELIQLMIQGKGNLSLADLQDQSAQLMACKASIKANQYLTRQEMEELLLHLSQVENPYTCPHGRPITVHFSLYEIEKMFKRVM